jgi:Protein of unknown function (DUF3592)
LTPGPSQSDPSRRPPTIPYAGGSAPAPAAAVTAPPAPPSPPRPITRVVARRTWAEPVVRFWIVATLVLVAIAAWFLAEQIVSFRSEKQLIATGTVVQATVIDADGDSRVDRQFPVHTPCELKFDWGKDQTINVSGTLASIPSNGYFHNGEKILLHVDPDDPTVWTDALEAEPVALRLITGIVIILAALITAAAALIARRGLLRLWRDGEAALYSVVETRHSALAPLSHTVRCVSSIGRDRTVVTVYLPTRFPRPQAGDVLWLIRRSGKSKSAVAARAFEV